ncbi:MAG TPA: lysylphosphatidylglycerol synthase transmembrane domain-containing protein [Thermotogota bacterium]|nr:lysylphosphatidylglycerol synthase transmembrane domain-containing protein [Thermotogota bacterium]
MLSNKKTITGILTGIIIGLIVLTFFTTGFGYSEFVRAISAFSWYYFIAGLGVYSLLWFFESLSFKVATSKFKMITFRNCFKTSVATQFVNLVTPFMSGGQVATIFVLNRVGLNLEKSTSAMIIKSMMFQTFITSFGLISLCTLYGELTRAARIASITGLILNTVVIFLIIIIGVRKTVAKKIITFFIFLLEKMRILNLNEKKKDQIYDNIEEFNDAFNAYRDDRGRLFKLFLMNGCQFGSMNLSSLIVLRGFGLTFSLKNYLRLFLISTSSFLVPTPGTSGGAEGLYYLFMNQNIPDEKIAASVIVWRLCTYYVPLMITGFFSFYFLARSSGGKKDEIEREKR